MTSVRRAGRAIAVCLLGLAASAASWADIVIGQTSGFTGPVASGARENTDGARLYLDEVNVLGGVHGQRIHLVSLDDRFDPKLAVENARKLITQHNVVSLFLTRGTPHTEAIRPLLDQYKVPLVGPSTGAMTLHEPAHPWVFNVRATYQGEAQKAVAHLAAIGMNRIAVMHVDDSFGEDCAAGARQGFRKWGIVPLFIEKFDRSKPDFDALARKAKAAEPQAILFFGPATTVSDGTRMLRAAGSRSQVVTLSNNASGGFIRLMGEHARGTIVTQVFPHERSLSARIVKEANDLAKRKRLTELTPAMLEGFAAAKVLVEGLRRAGPNPTPVRLQQALETLHRFDIGGMEVTYGPGDHTGLEYADLSIIGADGNFRR